MLFLVAEDWYFFTHRLPLAVAASQTGYNISVVTRVHQHAQAICSAGLTLIPLQGLRRSGMQPLEELVLLRELWRIYRRVNPDLVHHVGLKPVIYGSLVARLTGVRGVVNAMGGLGFIFSSSHVFARLLRPVIKRALSCGLKHGNLRTIVQNKSDFDVLTKTFGIASGCVRLIRGAGVDLRLYNAKPPDSKPPLVVLIARMLWDKGVGDFVEAAIRIRKAGVQARFALIGVPDPENPTSVPEVQLRAWHECGHIEWWGYRVDIPAVLEMATIACLPTFYGEGVPKALIEAMASRRAIVTTDIPGCRELVDGGRNGILVAPRDVAGLSAALKVLICDPERCRQMGEAGRLMVEQSLSLDRVLKETLDVYRELVPTREAG